MEERESSSSSSAAAAAARMIHFLVAAINMRSIQIPQSSLGELDSEKLCTVPIYVMQMEKMKVL